MLQPVVGRVGQHFHSIYFYSLGILVVSIPLNLRLSLYALGVSLSLGLINILLVERKLVFSSKLGHALVALWGVYCLSLLYTSDLSYGVKSVMQLAQLALIPLLLNFSLSPRRIAGLKDIFVASTAISLLFFIGRALSGLSGLSGGSIWGSSGGGLPYVNGFYYAELVAPHHPSYYAMYLLLAAAFVFDRFRFEVRVGRRALLAVLLLLLFFGVFLSSSRAGILAAVTVLVAMLLMLLWSSKKLYLSALFGVFALLAIPLLVASPRFDTVRASAGSLLGGDAEARQAALEAMDVRFKIWSVFASNADDAKLQDILIGQGVGDARQAIFRHYTDAGFAYALDERLNAHNQFIQTFFAVGLVGLGVLLYILGYAFWLAYRTRSAPLFLFLITIVVNFMFESALERGAGLAFFTFFITFLTAQRIGSRSGGHSCTK